MRENLFLSKIMVQVEDHYTWDWGMLYIRLKRKKYILPPICVDCTRTLLNNRSTAIIISKPAQQPSSPLNYTMNIYPNFITAATVSNDDTSFTSNTDAQTIIKMLQTKKEMYMKRCQDLEMMVHMLKKLLHVAKIQTKVQFWLFQEYSKKHPLSYERPTDFKGNKTSTIYIHNEIREMFQVSKIQTWEFSHLEWGTRVVLP